ncbi:MAG: cell division protein FtsZ, partial [Thermoplasmata archaeon]
ALRGAHMVFVTCGLGGGTGTGGAPVVSQIAKQEGALTIAVCTLPFRAEGWHRYQNAKAGLDRLRRVADTVITIPNDKLIELVPKLPLNQAFRFADEILMRAILGITDLILKPGLVNLDFNDLKTIMAGGGVSMIGMGEASGEDRVVKALENAINSPLLEVDLSTATGLLVNVIGGPGMTMKEAEKAVEELHRYVPEDANIIWGIAIDPEMGDKVRVMVVAANVTSPYILGKTTEEELRELGLDIIR